MISLTMLKLLTLTNLIPDFLSTISHPSLNHFHISHKKTVQIKNKRIFNPPTPATNPHQDLEVIQSAPPPSASSSSRLQDQDPKTLPTDLAGVSEFSSGHLI